MERRAFLQSLLAGTAALTLPKRVLGVSEKESPAGVPERHYEFEISPGDWAGGTRGCRLEVPGSGRAVATFKVEEGHAVRLTGIATMVASGLPVMVEVKNGFAMPMPCTQLEQMTELCGPVVRHEMPLVLDLHATSPESTDLVVALTFFGGPVEKDPPHVYRGQKPWRKQLGEQDGE